MPILANLEFDNNKQPLVSICVLTYNHEKYIKEAIDSFLMQNVNFKVEILIHDDASTDNTQFILKEYDRNYPGLFKLLLQKENQRSKFGGGMNPRFNFPRAQGKYIALCEGDDYWTDPLKLQKQMDFLENQEDFSLICGGFYRNENMNLNKVILQGKTKFVGKDLNGFSFDLNQFDQWKTKSLTMMFRNYPNLHNQLLNYKYSRDVVLIYLLLKLGKGFYIQETLGVYNVHEGGVHSGAKQIERLMFSVNCYRELYKKNGDNILRKILLREILALLNHKLYKSKCKTNDKLRLFIESLKLVRRFSDLKYFGFLMPIF